MLKIYINNEEVIANQNFTIQKHMLNTPSVVLNNVCPKTWCDSKDYITNFYHPLDYSKCKIIDEIYHPADPGITTIIDGSATLNNVDTTKSYELTEITGKTTQASTPTPDSPQPINVVSGRQDINVAGKNLFNKDSGFRNGYINASGNFVSAGTTACFNQYISCKPNTTYTLSFSKSIYAVASPLYYDSSKTFISRESVVNNITTRTFITPANCYYMVIQFNYDNSSTMTQEIIDSVNCQVEKGSTASEYEEYKGQSYEINLGKNLFNKNGDITLDYRLATDGYNYPDNGYYVSPYIKVEPNTTYTKNSPTENYQHRVCFYSSNNAGTFISKSEDNTITTPSNCQYLRFCGLQTELDTTQLEKGSSASSFSPYKTPIELCKIGDYKDRIYKDNGTWYLHKEIGKIVLDGTNVAFTYESQAILPNALMISKSSRPTGLPSVSSLITSHFSNIQAGSGSTLNTLYWGASTQMWICKDGFDSVANGNTWLQNNNVIVYYVLATPTTTEITDTELISQLESIELLEGLNNISITSADLTGNYTLHYNYSDAYTTEDLLFCGVVKNSGNISLNPRQPHYSTLQVLDFKTLLSEGETLDFVIYQKTILEAIQQVIATIQDYGFVLGNINILNPNDIIGAYSTKDKTAYDVFNYIADITQSRWTTRLIDENTVAIDFYDPTLMPQGTEIDYTNAYFNDKLIDDMKYSYGTNNYRNKQVMISNQVYSNISQTQTIVANGYQTQFPTEQPIGKINSITSNGIPLTFATFNEKNMGYVADFYYTPGENYFESDDLRSTGEILIIDYVAIVEGRQVITNASEIERINESTGRKGIIARYETRNDATTSTELQKIGESYIKYKGTPEIILTIQSRKNTWEVGQRVQFNAPIDELETEYMVRSKKINYIANQQENESQLFYTYELVSSFNSETEINYFDNQRAKSTGNIGEGEYISRNIDIESTAEIIFYETTTTEVVPSGDNELNAILNSPFIS